MTRPSWSLAAFFALAFGLNGCTSSSGQEQPACRVTSPTECPTPAVTYSDVSPIFDRHCANCHTGIGDAPWPLQNYEDVTDWKELVRAYVLDCTMPPPDSGSTITDAEREKILAWVRCGTLR